MSETPMSAKSCDLCGAYCRTFQVLVSNADAERERRIRSESIELPEYKQTSEHHFKLYPLPFHEACCFLGAQNRCSIYESRPDVCRKFQPGSDECRVARAAQGLAPL